MNIVDWLNANQGFAMSLLTLVYVVATVVIVYYNRRSIRELQEAREAESRPYIFVYLDKDPRDLIFYLRVWNFGKSGAKIDSIAISPMPNFNRGASPEDFLKNVIIAPSQILEFIVLEEKDEILKHDYSVCLTYSSVGNISKRFHEEYVLTIQYARQMGYTDKKQSKLSDEANALRNIANHLDSLRRNLP